MVKKTVLCVLSLLMVAVVACGGKYGDAVEVNEDFLDAMGDYLNGLEKADSSGKVADAMNAFADRMMVIGPEMKKISEKYPELKDENNQPEEFKELRKKSDEMEKKFAGSFMKTMQYMKDPEVRKAQQHLAEAMKTLAK